MSDFRARFIAELDTKKIDKQIKAIDKKKVFLENIDLKTKGLSAKIQESLNKHQFTLNLTNVKVDNISKKITGQVKSDGEKAGENFSNSLIKRVNDLLGNNGLQVPIDKFKAQYEKLFTVGTSDNKIHAQLIMVKNDLDELDRLQDVIKASTSDSELVANYQQFEGVLSRVKNNLNSATSVSKTFVSSLEIATLDNKIEGWLSKNTRATRAYGSQLGDLRKRLSKLQEQGGVTTSQFKSLENEFNTIKVLAAKSGATGKSFISTFQLGFKSILNYVSISTIIWNAIKGLKQMYSNIYDIDTAMTELKKVTNETDESYSKFLSNAAKVSKNIGTTIKDYIDSTANFSRLGYSFNDSQELAEAANIYSVVGDEIENIDAASKSLISTMAAYKIKAKDAIGIVDKFNEVGNNYAISSGGIGEALEKSASSLSAANNDLSQSIALITAANTVVQDPDAIGTALKTVSMRIRGAKTELEDAGLDTDGMAVSVSKLREEIQALSGVDIMKDKDTFKATYDILDEISSKWNELTDIQQASITELIAGKHQGNVISSLMQNFDIAREAFETANNSEGSAIAEHAKWMESLEAKTNQFKAAWEGLSESFMNDEFLKNAIDLGTNLLSVITKIIDTFGTIPTILTTAMLALSFKNVGRVKMSTLNSSNKMPTIVVFYLDINSLTSMLNEIHLDKRVLYSCSHYILCKSR